MKITYFLFLAICNVLLWFTNNRAMEPIVTQNTWQSDALPALKTAIKKEKAQENWPVVLNTCGQMFTFINNPQNQHLEAWVKSELVYELRGKFLAKCAVAFGLGALALNSHGRLLRSRYNLATLPFMKPSITSGALSTFLMAFSLRDFSKAKNVTPENVYDKEKKWLLKELKSIPVHAVEASDKMRLIHELEKSTQKHS